MSVPYISLHNILRLQPTPLTLLKCNSLPLHPIQTLDIEWNMLLHHRPPLLPILRPRLPHLLRQANERVNVDRHAARLAELVCVVFVPEEVGSEVLFAGD
jgi:hypothetical protein